MRAVRAAELLTNPELTDEGAAEIAEAFHDQPHMIREIRKYSGYTPSQLRNADEPLSQTMLRMQNLEKPGFFRVIGR